MNIWRIGANWGGVSILDIFLDYGIAFFHPCSNRIGNYTQVCIGDIVMISDMGKDVVALAYISSKATPIENLGIILGFDAKAYIYSLETAIEQGLFCRLASAR